jgi:hypothetical protein
MSESNIYSDDRFCDSALLAFHNPIGGLHMQTKTTSRRAVLAGAATLVSTGIGAAGIAPTKAIDSDPIFAAIERHKEAFRLSQIAGRIDVNTIDVEGSPDYDPVECRAVKENRGAAYDVASTAAFALTTVQPTTMAGVLALIHHVEAFNAGAFFLEPDSRWPEDSGPEWQSAPVHWPESEDEDAIDLFGFAILANVRRALEANGGAVMTAQLLKHPRKLESTDLLGLRKLCE